MGDDGRDDGRHPHFDDRRAIRWRRSLDDALAEAAARGAAVFVQAGRRSCDGTRAFIEKTIWKDEIADYLNAHFVSVAVDLDAMDDDRARAVVESLPRQAPTPLCAYLAAPGARLLHSTAGARPAAVFLRDMIEAVGRK